jgi:ankyrin repeat protein
MAGLFLTLAGAAPVAAAGDARLADAVKQRDTAAARVLLEKHADVNLAQPDGATALHWAAYWNDVDTADRLIRAGANVNAANDLGITPLFLASANEDATLVMKLLKSGANPNAAAMSGESPLMTAARAGTREAVKALLAHGADVNAREASHDQTALMWAAVNRHPEVVEALLRGGADINARSRVRLRKALILTNRQASYNPGAYEQHVKNGDIVEVEEGGYTALLFAAQQGDVASGKLLLAAGANLNETAPIGMSALVVAAYSDKLEFGKFLLDKGADPNAAGAGYTALHAAVLKGNLDFVNALLAHGTDVNARLTKANGARRQSADYAFGRGLVGATPLYLAATFGEIPIMRALVAAHADLKFAMPDGTTPLMAAMDTPVTDSGDIEGLGKDRRDRYVFFRRVHTKSPDEFSVQTPEEVEHEVLEIAKIEMAGGVDVNAADKSGDTAMHLAAAKGLNSVVEFLVSNGASVNVKNGRRQTPLDLADAPRRNRGGDQLGNQASTVTLLRSLGGEEGGEPVPDIRRRKTPR